MKKYIVEQVRGRPKYSHIALNFQSDFPNLLDLRAIFSQSQRPLAPGSERQENPCNDADQTAIKCRLIHTFNVCIHVYGKRSFSQDDLCFVALGLQ